MLASKHGNLVIGQSGGATAVINASLVGAFETAQNSIEYGKNYRWRMTGGLAPTTIQLHRI